MPVSLKKPSVVASIEQAGKLKTPKLDESALKGQEVLSALPMANVGMSMGLTIRMAEFESVKVSVSLNLPVADFANEKALSTAFAFVEDWVSTKVATLKDEIEKNL